jgi:hypothetical protein
VAKTAKKENRMKLVKLTLVVVAMLAISAPAFALCGFCTDPDVNGSTFCDGTPGIPCHQVHHQGDPPWTECISGSGFCSTAHAQAAVSEEWSVASVETNGVVTADDVPQMRTARVEGSRAEATATR